MDRHDSESLVIIVVSEGQAQCELTAAMTAMIKTHTYIPWTGQHDFFFFFF
jgi:hypothetical protein